MRLMLAGTGSGCGKTTVTLALIKVLMRRGFTVQAFKAGPDYIDAGYHCRATGRPSHSLDPYMLSRYALVQLISLGMEGADIGVIEGAMGYYDGIGAEGKCSAHALAAATDTPVVLIIDATGSASSAAAVALGFCRYMEDSRIAGFFINRISTERQYDLIRTAIECITGLPCIGYLKKDAAPAWQSRHLGLIQASEQTRFDVQLETLADNVVLSEEALFAISRNARTVTPKPFIVAPLHKPFRMGIALDEAFCFYYPASFAMLRRMGMDLVFFSPCADTRLPEALDGIYLGGGYPELYKETLSQNISFLRSLKNALEEGIPCYAECGGMMLLGEEIDGAKMAGFLPVRFTMTERLQRFGYVTVTDPRTGISYPAHEFHYSRELDGEGTALRIKKASNGVLYRGGYRKLNTLAAYPHAYFWGNEALVKALWGLS